MFPIISHDFPIYEPPVGDDLLMISQCFPHDFPRFPPFFSPFAMVFSDSPPRRHDLQQGRSRTPEKLRQQGSPLLQNMLQLCLSSQNLTIFWGFDFGDPKIWLVGSAKQLEIQETGEPAVIGKRWKEKWRENSGYQKQTCCLQILIPKFERNSLEWSPPQ